MVLVLTLAACDGGARQEPPKQAQDLPPLNAVETIDAIYGGRLAELGLRLTRAARYEEQVEHIDEGPSPTGTHLALYAEPAETFTTARFVANIAPLTKVFEDVFERWPGLTSFDICQEPVQQPDDRNERPVPMSQVRMTQPQALMLDWESLDLTAIVLAASMEPPRVSIFVAPIVRRHPDYREAFEATDQGSRTSP